MLTIIWANAQPGKISRLERMSPEAWEERSKTLPPSARIQIDCDKDTILVLDPSFSPLTLEEWNEDRELKFVNGLIPVVTMDPKGFFLMQAFSNKETVRLTAKESMGIYFSRSRNSIWRKGDTSGHIQKLHRILVSPSGDFLVYEVEQEGAACHEGYYSCFFREAGNRGDWKILDIPFLGK